MSRLVRLAIALVAVVIAGVVASGQQRMAPDFFPDFPRENALMNCHKPLRRHFRK